jgi:hypothetical protein
MTALVYRQAALADAAEIHALLLELAPEIPLLVDTLEREEALYALIRSCARAGESWVACDEGRGGGGGGRIVGVVLAERSQFGRHYAEHEVVELRHVGVATGYREQDVAGRLIGSIMGRMVPVIATVSPHNRSGLAASLERLGFRPTGAIGGERHFRWEPGAPARSPGFP